jgi:hypothetical protein
LEGFELGEDLLAALLDEMPEENGHGAALGLRVRALLAGVWPRSPESAS